MSDFSVEQRPPSRWNTVRHQHGVVSAIAWNTQETPELDVDEEAAWDFLQFIADEKIKLYHRKETLDWTVGAMEYLQYGTVTLATGQSSAIDSMIRRSQWLQRHELHGHQTAESLRARCCTLNETQAELFA